MFRQVDTAQMYGDGRGNPSSKVAITHALVYSNHRRSSSSSSSRFVCSQSQVKALLRRATARTALLKYNEAESDLRAVIALQPNNRQAREDITNLRIMKAEMSAAEQRAAAEYRSAAMQQQASGSGGMGGGFDMGVPGLGGGAMNGQGPDLSKMSPLQVQQFMQQNMARGSM